MFDLYEAHEDKLAVQAFAEETARQAQLAQQQYDQANANYSAGVQKIFNNWLSTVPGPTPPAASSPTQTVNVQPDFITAQQLRQQADQAMANDWISCMGLKRRHPPVLTNDDKAVIAGACVHAGLSYE